IPAIFRPAHNRSFGHLRANRDASAGAAAAAAAWSERAATKPNCGAAAAGAGSISISVAYRLPTGDIHARPRRPRPVLCSFATIQSGPRSPALASRSASALVESTKSRNFTDALLDRSDFIASARSGHIEAPLRRNGRAGPG